MKRNRWLSGWKIVAGVLLVVGFAAAIDRYSRGLGATTNLSDTFPWGLWIGFDILVGVGLAAGGFIVAGTVHLLNLERFKPILRPSILTAFLGYLLVIAGLMVDLGRPWAIWHALIYWNPHSVMFEVAWCVMLYTTVLALEFSPVVFERFKLRRAQRIIRSITIPLVVAGVVLSTLHQSSLGSLFLIIPGRMHPLWYSNILPFLFILSCLAAGLSMIIFESYLSSRVFKKEIELTLLSDISRALVVVLVLYFTVRVQDIFSRGAEGFIFQWTYQSGLFLGEVIVGVVVPVLLLLSRRMRTNKKGLFYSSVFVILGFVSHRINTAITSMEQWPNHVYVPSWQELGITVGLVAAGFVTFGIIVQYFRVFTTESESEPKAAYHVQLFPEVQSPRETPVLTKHG